MGSDRNAVGAFEAKTKFSEILKRVESGERITITRRGIAIAEVVPAKKSHNRESLCKVVSELREFRKGRKVDVAELRQMIAEGRRF